MSVMNGLIYRMVYLRTPVHWCMTLELNFKEHYIYDVYVALFTKLINRGLYKSHSRELGVAS